MKFYAKMFDELSAGEIYEILRSRAEIFLLEQNIVCQDMDGEDYKCLHCFYNDDKKVVACLRAFVSDEDEDVVMVGRVLTLVHKKGLGTELMNNSIRKIKEKFAPKKLMVHAQTQAIGFYEKFGFVTVSDEYLEEGVPHVTMEYIL